MKIVIPMSGYGERFRRAGYKVPKPLVTINGKPIIEYVTELFPGKENSFIFICNKDHLATTEMRSILNSLDLNGDIVSIKSHKKGPIYAVQQAYDLIDDDEQVIVNYCDFSCYWDFLHFKQYCDSADVDGALPAYRGFHPHSYGTTNYAYIKEENNIMQRISEKKPFTENRVDEYASTGTYYFRRGSTLKKYFDRTIERDINVNGEYYCSLPYNLMVDDGLRVGVYEISHFMQWGTPEDVREYNYYSDIFNLLTHGDCHAEDINQSHTAVLTMAGHGSRFSKEGYKVPKPLIKPYNTPMFIEALRGVPKFDSLVVTCLDEIAACPEFVNAQKLLPNHDLLTLPDTPPGQALTFEKSLEVCKDNQLVTLTACDHRNLFFPKEFNQLIHKYDPDIVVWSAQGFPGAIKNPEMYGWLELSDDDITIERANVKQAPSDPVNGYIVTGTFTFKNKQIALSCIKQLKEQGKTVNGELYVDSILNLAQSMGLRAISFPVKSYICWGTPYELKTFQYWETCFKKWGLHSYTGYN